ncbi:hypothetical protein J6590_049433 [Homalodisca vitripennis]|nr:hypothetical protein J6590_049433 [Homalodisca vitripennis]
MQREVRWMCQLVCIDRRPRLVRRPSSSFYRSIKGRIIIRVYAKSTLRATLSRDPTQHSLFS